MTSEEYLRACGWKSLWAHAIVEGEYKWVHDRLSERRALALDEAVETQLAEDRARYNFVRERSEIENGLLVAPFAERYES